MKIVVNDASIMIDLIKIDLLDLFFNLDFEMHTTDFVINECLSDTKKMLKRHIRKGNLIIKSYDDLSELNEIFNKTSGLSPADCSIFKLSTDLNAILLSGDKKLRDVAENAGMKIKGIFWIFDEMLKLKVIDKRTYIKKLKELEKINLWLPEGEFKKRLK